MVSNSSTYYVQNTVNRLVYALLKTAILKLSGQMAEEACWRVWDVLPLSSSLEIALPRKERQPSFSGRSQRRMNSRALRSEVDLLPSEMRQKRERLGFSPPGRIMYRLSF